MDDLPRSLQKPAIHCLMALSVQTQPNTGCKCWSPCPQQLSATGLISPALASVQTGPREAASTENRRLPTYFHPFFCPEVNFRPGVTGEQKGPGTSPRSPLQHQKATGQTTFPYINCNFSSAWTIKDSVRRSSCQHLDLTTFPCPIRAVFRSASSHLNNSFCPGSFLIMLSL